MVKSRSQGPAKCFTNITLSDPFDNCLNDVLLPPHLQMEETRVPDVQQQAGSPGELVKQK